MLQYDDTPAGQRFIEAGRRARVIVDRGGHNGTVEPAKTNGGTPATVPAK